MMKTAYRWMMHSSAAVAKTHDGDDTSEHAGKDAKPDDEKTAEVVSLDTFRKKTDKLNHLKKFMMGVPFGRYHTK